MEKKPENLSSLLNYIKCPLFTEKSASLHAQNQYTFLVDRYLKKIQIKFVLENFFNIKIVKVRTCILPHKTKRVGKFIGRRTTYKKVFIKLREGDTINEFFN